MQIFILLDPLSVFQESHIALWIAVFSDGSGLASVLTILVPYIWIQHRQDRVT